MKQVLQRSLLLIFCLCIGLLAIGQKEKKKKKKKEKTGIETYLPTENTKLSSNYIPKGIPSKENYKLIYVASPKGTMYGNPCAYQATHDFGFEYIVEPRKKGAARSRTKAGKFLNNLWVKTGLVFTRTPFWKARLNSKFKKCKTSTGDFVG